MTRTRSDDAVPAPGDNPGSAQSPAVAAQVADVDAALATRFDAYRREYADLEPADLYRQLKLGEPSPKLDFDPAGAKYFQSVKTALKLTPQETSTLQRTGLVNVDVGQPFSMGGAYYSIWALDLPVLITSDSILHAWHRSYDQALKDLEVTLFIEQIDGALSALSVELGKAAPKLSGPMSSSVADVDLYLTVARNLLAGAGAPGDPLGQRAQANPAAATGQAAAKAKSAGTALGAGKLLHSSLTGLDSQVAELLVNIGSLELENVFDAKAMTTLYGGRRAIDYSQFKPRGHYTESPELQRYFRTMMWLGRADTAFLLTPPQPQTNWTSDVSRERRSAFLLAQLLPKTQQLSGLRAMSRTIDFLVGRSDDVTVDSVISALNATGLGEPAQLAADDNVQRVMQALGTNRQQIRSAALAANSDGAQETELPSHFQLFGQRFVIDSFVLSKVVFDSIIYKGNKSERMLPSGLDVMAALGNREAVKALAPELEHFNYSANLLAAQRVITDYSAAGDLEKSAYGMWLEALRTLDDIPSSPHFPQLMRTPIWQKKQLQTELASWAELRHDTLLYAKQSYTSVPGCSYPEAYVEPYPALFERLTMLAQETASHLAQVDVSRQDARLQVKLQRFRADLVGFFDHFAQTMLRLRTLAEKELRAEPFTAEETTFLEDTLQISHRGSGPPRYDGWYPTLIYGGSPAEFKPTVADVHTDPGSGTALEVAVGGVNFIAAAIDNNGDRAIYVGPVYSYYEFTQPVSNRLDDEQWEQLVRHEAPARPKWTRDFVGVGTRRSLESQGARTKPKVGAVKPVRDPRAELNELRKHAQLVKTDRERAAGERQIARLEAQICAKAKPFDEKGVRQRVDAQLRNLRSCVAASSPVLKLEGSASLFFLPSGEGDVRLYLPGVDASTLACIEGRLRGVKTKPFCGLPQELSFWIQQ